MLKFGICLMSLGFIACAKPASDSLQPAPKANVPVESETIDLTTLGGAPGSISVAGIIVETNKKGLIRLDDRIKVQFLVGKNAAGKNIPADPAKFKIKKAKIQTQNTKARYGQDLFPLGCSEEIIQQVMQERGLKKITGPLLQSKEILAISANTVLLCGPLDLKHGSVTVDAKTLILADLDLRQNKSPGMNLFTARELVLLGKNQISMIDDSSISLGSLDLKITDSISSDEAGTLLLSAEGKAYQAAANK